MTSVIFWLEPKYSRLAQKENLTTNILVRLPRQWFLKSCLLLFKTENICNQYVPFVSVVLQTSLNDYLCHEWTNVTTRYEDLTVPICLCIKCIDKYVITMNYMSMAITWNKWIILFFQDSLNYKWSRSKALKTQLLDRSQHNQ